MRSLLPVLLLLPSIALAQTPPNNRHLFAVGEGAASPWFITSGVATRLQGSSNGDNEFLSEISAGAFRGVGAANNTTCQLTGQVFKIQDSDQTTAAPYKVVVRKALTPDGLADGSPAGIIAISAQQSLGPGTGTGGVLWQVTWTWSTPITVPCETGYYVGFEIFPWVSATDYTLASTAGTFSGTAGDNPRQIAPKIHATWVDQPAGVALRSTTQRTLAIASLTSQATLNIGNLDGAAANYKSFGLGGLYPWIKSASRDDGLQVRIQDGSNAGGFCVTFLSSGFLPGGLTLPGFAGAVWLSPNVLIDVNTGTIPTAAPYVYENPLIPAGAIPPIYGTTLMFAGATVSATFTNGRLTNAQAVSF